MQGSKGMNVFTKSRIAAAAVVALTGIAICGKSDAAVIEFSFTQAVTPPSAVAGSAPWLHVKIADTTPGHVAVTVSASLTGLKR